eukprot:CAMPEP_0204880298 /NCGR_PEP_ID=MMETSP1349-20130617/1718_1 /ASSEMBLY_ACC=CAM_ASM_000710 /TAXON_ID=215587 /ORGANISM="Aplanochytrium stocchinoi, Strain GSBS06" /LENGTH=91 /DNA_ID=CAMNT_0052038685 /DNA_START=243 /DNA_END=518 /DNA_ORIENTATION=-
MSQRISVFVENERSAAKSMDIIRSMLRKINADIMGTGLHWNTFLEDSTSGELFAYNEAQKQQIMPWFVQKLKNTANSDKNSINLESFLESL